jgi:hypothetical protein
MVLQRIPFARSIAFCLVFTFLLYVTPSHLYGQGEEQAQPKVSNIDWKIQEDIIVVSYDFAGDTAKTYDVSLLLRKESDPSYRIIPKHATGDIGKVTPNFKRRSIFWNYRMDLKTGLGPAKYYFEFKTHSIDEGIPWTYYAAGLGAVAGGLVAFMIFKGGGAPGEGGLPGPPSRP